MEILNFFNIFKSRPLTRLCTLCPVGRSASSFTFINISWNCNFCTLFTTFVYAEHDFEESPLWSGAVFSQNAILCSLISHEILSLLNDTYGPPCNCDKFFLMYYVNPFKEILSKNKSWNFVPIIYNFIILATCNFVIHLFQQDKEIPGINSVMYFIAIIPRINSS